VDGLPRGFVHEAAGESFFSSRLVALQYIKILIECEDFGARLCEPLHVRAPFVLR
jgi:hypothetical protein